MYECHLTFEAKWAEIIETAAANLAERGVHWKFSIIAGDPVLGDKAYCYLTKHSENGWAMIEEVPLITCFTCVDPIRVKLEKIEYDTKTGIDNSGGRFD